MKPDELRKAVGLTQVQMAEKLGCPASLISMVENGTRLPTFSLLQKYEREFPGKITLADFITN